MLLCGVRACPSRESQVGLIGAAADAPTQRLPRRLHECQVAAESARLSLGGMSRLASTRASREGDSSSLGRVGVLSFQIRPQRLRSRIECPPQSAELARVVEQESAVLCAQGQRIPVFRSLWASTAGELTVWTALHDCEPAYIARSGPHRWIAVRSGATRPGAPTGTFLTPAGDPHGGSHRHREQPATRWRRGRGQPRCHRQLVPTRRRVSGPLRER